MTRPLSAYHPDTLHQRLVDLGEDWADKNAAADLLEETQKTLLAKLTIDATLRGAKSVAAAEMVAKSSDEYAAHLVATNEARRIANRARVAYDAAKVWVEMARTLESSRRAEMGMR